MELAINKELSSLITKLSDDEYSQLEQNILEEGCRDALVVWQPSEYDIPIILDGHNRYKICQEHAVEFTMIYSQVASRHEAKIWIINNQLGRRNLTKEQMAFLRGKRYKQEKQERGGDRKSSGHYDHLILPDQEPSTADKLAAEYKVSPKTIRRDEQFASAVDAVAEMGDEDTKDKILQGNIGMTQKDVRDLAALKEEDEEKAKDVLQRVLEDETLNVKTAMAQMEVEDESVSLPDGPFQVIVANSSPSMPPLPKELAAEDSTLWLWTSNTNLPAALKIMQIWGFKFKTILTWVKDKAKSGSLLRDKTEHCLIGTKGNPATTTTYQTTIVSDNQDEFYRLVEGLCPGSKINLFAHVDREGWYTTQPVQNATINEGF